MTARSQFTAGNLTGNRDALEVGFEDTLQRQIQVADAVQAVPAVRA